VEVNALSKLSIKTVRGERAEVSSFKHKAEDLFGPLFRDSVAKVHRVLVVVGSVTNDSVTNLDPPNDLVLVVRSTATSELDRALREDRQDVKGSVLDVVSASGLVSVTKERKPSVKHTLFVAGRKTVVIENTLFSVPANKSRLQRTPQGDHRGNLVDLEGGNVDVDVSRATIRVVDSYRVCLEQVEQSLDHVASLGDIDSSGSHILVAATKRAVGLDVPTTSGFGGNDTVNVNVTGQVVSLYLQLDTYVTEYGKAAPARGVYFVTGAKNERIVNLLLTENVSERHDIKAPEYRRCQECGWP
jgi:hypothetical protein